MEIFSASLALCAGNSRVKGPVNSPHKDQWRRALMFSLICAWISGRVTTREGRDLRRRRAHYDVIVTHWLVRPRYVLYGRLLNTLRPKKWLAFCRRLCNFFFIFLNETFWMSNETVKCYSGFNRQWVSIGWDNGTEINQVVWHHITSLCHNGLN